MHVDQGIIYLTDKFNHCVVEISLAGQYLQSWGSKGTKPGQSWDPGALTTASLRGESQRLVVVGDNTGNRVQVFGPGGVFRWSWTHFLSVTDVTAVSDAHGDALLLVGDAGRDRIEVLRLNERTVLFEWPLTQPTNLSAMRGPFGCVLALSDWHGHHTWNLTTWPFQTRTLLLPSNTGTIDEVDHDIGLPMRDVESLAITHNGCVVLAGGYEACLWVFRWDGTYMDTWACRTSSTIRCVAVDPVGRTLTTYDDDEFLFETHAYE